MTVTLTSPVTGAAQTGFTSPSFTIVQDTAVDSNAKRWIVTTVSGTGLSGVRPHTVSDEFSITFVKPKIMKAIKAFSSLLPNSFKPDFNRYWVIVKKGGLPAAGLVPVPMSIRIPIDIPAGVDSYDADDMRAMVSLAFGALNQVSAGLGDTLANGAL